MAEQFYSWKEMAGRPYLKRLSPWMLTSGGEKIFKFFCTPSEARSVSRKASTGQEPEKIGGTVVYDREYLINKIAHDLIKPLGLKCVDDYYQLVDEAWESVHNSTIEE